MFSCNITTPQNHPSLTVYTNAENVAQVAQVTTHRTFHLARDSAALFSSVKSRWILVIALHKGGSLQKTLYSAFAANPGGLKIIRSLENHCISSLLMIWPHRPRSCSGKLPGWYCVIWEMPFVIKQHRPS